MSLKVDTTYLQLQQVWVTCFQRDHVDSSNERASSGQDTKFWKEKAVLPEELEQTNLVKKFTFEGFQF